MLETLLGLNRAGKYLYLTLFVLAVPALTFWTVVLPRMRFSDEDERLFRAARHGDGVAVARSLDAGAGVNDESPVDRKTALFRAAVFGHAEVVRLLLDRGADPQARGSDGRTALEVVDAARKDEKNAAVLRGLDDVVSVLRAATGEQ